MKQETRPYSYFGALDAFKGRYTHQGLDAEERSLISSHISRVVESKDATVIDRLAEYLPWADYPEELHLNAARALIEAGRSEVLVRAGQEFMCYPSVPIKALSEGFDNGKVSAAKIWPLLQHASQVIWSSGGEYSRTTSLQLADIINKVGVPVQLPGAAIDNMDYDIVVLLGDNLKSRKSLG